MEITQDTSITQEIQCSFLRIVLSKKQKSKWLPLNKKKYETKLIKVRSFSGAKVSCMYDHVKPTIREFNPNHIKVVGQLVRYQGQSLTLHCP